MLSDRRSDRFRSQLASTATEMTTSDRTADIRADMAGHIPSLRRYARMLCRDADRADDLVQESLLRAIDKLHLFVPGTNLRAWLFTILRNQFLNRSRREDFERGWAASQLEDAASRDASDVVPTHRIALAQVSAHLEALPEAMRELLLLVAIDGMSYEQAAAVTDVPIGTVRSRLSRARQALLAMQGGEVAA